MPSPDPGLPPLSRHIADVPNLATLSNVLVGYAAIMTSILGWHAVSLVLLVLAVHIDHADGAMARAIPGRPRENSLFGGQLDSLSDLVNFGLAPAVILVLMGGWSAPSLIVGAALVSAATVRLAYFNVHGMDGPYFRGLTTTYAGFLFAVGGLAFLRGILPLHLFYAFCITLAALEVSSFRLRKYGYSHWCVLAAAGLFAAAAFISGEHR